MIRWRDHPRVCGEHLACVVTLLLAAGSSPRMRGTRMRSSVRGIQIGIIPAYAGNTASCSSSTHCSRDHPRVCGEHSADPWMLSEATGSSPRMRGTQVRRGVRLGRRGIIPAYAGNTTTGAPAAGTCRDHPRVCGEHWRCRTGMLNVRGSSPRMRGTH